MAFGLVDEALDAARVQMLPPIWRDASALRIKVAGVTEAAAWETVQERGSTAPIWRMAAHHVQTGSAIASLEGSERDDEVPSYRSALASEPPIWAAWAAWVTGVRPETRAPVTAEDQADPGAPSVWSAPPIWATWRR